MSDHAPRGEKAPRTDSRIAGPIPEYNRFDEYTGTTYYRCTECGAEALERRDLAGCCDDA